MTQNDTMHRSEAVVPTAKASGYLQQLCMHFSHRIPASFDASQGRLQFEGGVCGLDARVPDALRLEISAGTAEHLARLQDVVARHLERFAFREEIQIAWRPA